MDAIDRKILTHLQQDADVSIAELAERVGLSQTPCWKRIQKLEQSGVIVKRVALVSPEALGLGLTVFVQIETSDHSGPWLAQFATQVSAMPEVMELYRMAGDVDYMLRVVVADMQAYDRFLQDADRDDPAEERHLALRHGADQVHHGLSRAGAGEIDERPRTHLQPLSARGSAWVQSVSRRHCEER